MSRTRRTLPGRPALAAVALVGAVALTGCGQGDDGAESADPPASSETTPTTQEPTMTTPTPEEPTASQKPGSVATVTGTVAAGVEPGCRLLQTGGETLLLVGVDATSAPEGEQLTVTGTRAPDLLTTCQEGVPFQVRSVEQGG